LTGNLKQNIFGISILATILSQLFKKSFHIGKLWKRIYWSEATNFECLLCYHSSIKNKHKSSHNVAVSTRATN